MLRPFPAAAQKIPTMPKITFQLNGKPTTASYEPGMDFLEVLREECGIISAKNGCAPEGTCGCCTVLVDGRPVMACLRKPEQMEGHEVTTLEGIEPEMHRVLWRRVRDGRRRAVRLLHSREFWFAPHLC